MANSDLSETPVQPERKATLRLGQRELSRLSLVVVVLIVVPLLFGLYRVFLGFRAQRDVVVAQDNLHALYNAMSAYANDWDQKLPPAESWTDKVAGYLSAPANKPGGRLSYLHGSGDNGEISYAYNELASEYNLDPIAREKEFQTTHKKIVDPARLILLIEQPGAGPNAHVSIPPQDSVQGEEALAKQLAFPHYSDQGDNATTLVLFANGNIVRYTRRDLKQ